jgi:hypothetical protein
VSLVLLVLFVMVMFVWMLALVGILGVRPAGDYFAPWLAWVAVLLLGLAVFVTGPVVWRVP